MSDLTRQIEKLCAGHWEVDCASMTLTRNDTQPPKLLLGKGNLRQNEEGTICYTLYPTVVDNIKPLEGLEPPGRAGEIIAPDSYYRLQAVVQDDVTWEVEQTSPNLSATFINGTYHHIASGDAHEIRLSRPHATGTKHSYLKIVFFSNVTIPCNTTTETITVVGGLTRSKSSSLNAARFETAFGTFDISQRAGMLVVEIKATAPFPLHFESRVIESLMFVLACPLHWNVIDKTEGGTQTVKMQGKSRATDTRFPRPVQGEHQDIDMKGDVWRLFEKYLTLACSHNDAGFHPCTRYLYGVLESRAGGLTSWGLTLGVAVEGLTRELFPNTGHPMPGMKTLVPELRKHCLSWNGFAADDWTALRDSVKTRLQSLVGQLCHVRTKDRLYALAKTKAICEKHIKTWDEVRNKTAHGLDPGSGDTQSLLDMCHEVTVLMYHLIFKAAQYEGPYTDYSVYGWPTKQYRGRPVTEEEIAVAAYFLYEASGRKVGHDMTNWLAGREKLEDGEA